MEKIPRKTRSGMLEAGLVAASLISPFAAEKIEAAETAPGTTWEQGLKEARDDVFNAPFERSRFYVKRTEADQYGSEYFLGSRAGRKLGVGPHTETRDAIISDIKEGKIETVCYFHTHPVLPGEDLSLEDASAIKAQYKSGGAVTFAWPPSQIDLHTFEVRHEKLFEFKSSTMYIEATMDASGTTYYRPLGEKDRAEHGERMKILEYRKKLEVEWRKEAEKRIRALGARKAQEIFDGAVEAWEVHMSQFDDETQRRLKKLPLGIHVEGLLRRNEPSVVQSIFPDEDGKMLHDLYQTDSRIPDDEDARDLRNQVVSYMKTSVKELPSPEAYQKLTNAYLNNGFIVRFAPYGAEEPPCAGPDYRAQ